MATNSKVILSNVLFVLLCLGICSAARTLFTLEDHVSGGYGGGGVEHGGAGYGEGAGGGEGAGAGYGAAGGGSGGAGAEGGGYGGGAGKGGGEGYGGGGAKSRH